MGFQLSSLVPRRAAIAGENTRRVFAPLLLHLLNRDGISVYKLPAMLSEAAFLEDAPC
jgi:hypothetical protein